MANIDETIRKLEEKSNPVPTPINKEPAPRKGSEKRAVTSFDALPSDEDATRNQRNAREPESVREHPVFDATANDTRSQRSAWKPESVRERSERSASDLSDDFQAENNMGFSWEEEPLSVPEDFPGLFDNRQNETFSDFPPSPVAQSSDFWTEFFEGIPFPPLWGIDLVLILISLTGLGWIALHWSMALDFLAGMVYLAISSALMPLFEILLFLLTLAVIVAALRGMCAPRRFC